MGAATCLSRTLWRSPFPHAVKSCFHGMKNWDARSIASRRFSFSRMMDMGGAPSALNDDKSAARRINASKNCLVQAIAFDFNLLTKSSATDGTSEMVVMTPEQPAAPSKSESVLGNVQPDTHMIQQLADLLNVDLGGIVGGKIKATKKEEDDLSRLTGEEKPSSNSNTEKSMVSGPYISTDIRNKYADKLFKRGVSGVQGVDLAKHQIENTLKRGDAGGHLAARARLTAEPTTAGKRWMALSGTGKLLQYLTQRSMKIVLLPSPSPQSTNEEEEGQKMEEFKKQLSDVVFDVLLKDGSLGAPVLVQQAVANLQMDPKHIMLVSDRDDYLRAANEAGMVTCRLRPENARRGNVSVQYIVPSLPEVRTAIDEANGISFNVVMKGR